MDMTKNIEYLMNVGLQARPVTGASRLGADIVRDLRENEEAAHTNPVGAGSLYKRIQDYKNAIEEAGKNLKPGQEVLKAGLRDLYAELLKIEFNIKRYLGKEHGVPAARAAVNNHLKGLYSAMD